MSSKITRRNLMKNIAMATAITAGAGTAIFFPWKNNRVWAAGTKPIKIGLTHDASGQFANSGQAEKRGTIMAIEEANAKGGVAGRKVEYVWMDTETTPQTGTRVAERLITRENVHFLVGAIQSGTANAISQVAQKYGCVYFNTSSSSPTESGKNCHRVKFVWDGSGENYSRAAAKNAIDAFGKKWMFLHNDYVWGQNTNKATKMVATGYGATAIDEVAIPVGTRDFSAILLKIQQQKPDVVAAAVGGDDFKVMRKQVSDMGLDSKPAWLNNQQDWPDIYGLGSDAAFGVFGTTWYHMLDLPGVKEFVARYQSRYPTTRIAVPGNVTYNGYVASRVAFLGYNVWLYKFIIFTLSCAISGLAGALFAMAQEGAYINIMSLQWSGIAILIVLIGGGFVSFWGPVLGVVFYFLARDILGAYTETWLLWFGLIFVAMVMFKPESLAGIWRDALRLLGRKPHSGIDPQPDPSTAEGD